MIPVSRLQYLEIKLAALEMSALLDPLLAMQGLQLGGKYELCYPYDVGGQGILFMARPLGVEDCNVLAKMPMLEYHRPPAYITSKAIAIARQRIEHEAAILCRFQNTILPTYYDVVYGTNPLHAPEWGPDITEHEVYLIMEFIHGRGLEQAVGEMHHATDCNYRQLERIALLVAESILDLCEILCEDETGFLYSDIRPANVLLTDSEHPVRMIDAGSIIPMKPTEDAGLDIPFSESYVPVDVYESYQLGRLVWPDRRFAVCTLGRTLYQVATNRIPLPGDELDFEVDPMPRYSRLFVDYLKLLTDGRQTSFTVLRQIARQLLDSRPSD